MMEKGLDDDDDGMCTLDRGDKAKMALMVLNICGACFLTL